MQAWGAPAHAQEKACFWLASQARPWSHVARSFFWFDAKGRATAACPSVAEVRSLLGIPCFGALRPPCRLRKKQSAGRAFIVSMTGTALDQVHDTLARRRDARQVPFRSFQCVVADGTAHACLHWKKQDTGVKAVDGFVRTWLKGPCGLFQWTVKIK